MKRRKNTYQFYRTTLEEFQQKNLRSFIYLSRVANNKRRDGYVDAIRKAVFMHPVNEPAILEGVYEPYEYRNGQKLLSVVLSFTIGSLVWLAMIIIAPFQDGEPQSYLRGTAKNSNQVID